MSAPANLVTEAYLAECATPDSRLRRALAELDVSETTRAAWPRLLPRPVMVGEAEFLAFGRDLVTIFELVTSLPQRCFDGDFERFRAALGIDDRRGAWMRRLLGDGPPPLYGRADTYYDGSSFKLLEFNIGGALGGVDTVGLLPKAYLRIPAFAEFAAEHGLGRVVGEISDLTFRAGKPYLHGTGIDVILRYYGLDEMLAHPDGDALMEPVFRAHENGTVVVWTPSNVFGNKGTLAMLSEFAEDASVFSAQERAVIERVLPWSRMLGRHGAETDKRFISECMQRQQKLVFKPTGLFGGQGVLIGREVDPRTWREALAASTQTGCLVQEIVQPNVEPVIEPQTGARSEWYALWGAYLTPAGLSGGGVRAVPPGGSTVINMSNNTLVRNTCVFTC